MKYPLCLTVAFLAINICHAAENAKGLYSIMSDEAVATIKRSVDVRLSAKLSEEDLSDVAKEIRSLSRRQFDRTFISYYLSGQTVGAGAWATTHFDPQLRVRILGEPKEIRPPLTKSGGASDETIGAWTYVGPPESTFILRRKGRGFLLTQQFGDGSKLEQDVTAVRQGKNIIIRPSERNPSGDYWIYDEVKNLVLMDKVGAIGKAMAIPLR